HPADDVLAKMHHARLDVIVRLGFAAFPPRCAAGATYGVWAFNHRDKDHYRGGPPYFWEMVHDDPVSAVSLECVTERRQSGMTLAKGYFATDRRSLARNQLQPYYGSTHFVVQKLRELHQGGWAWLEKQSIPDGTYVGRRSTYSPPTSWELARWLTPQLLSKAMTTTRRVLKGDEVTHWRIAIRSRRDVGSMPNPADMSGFHWVESPKGHAYADPFLIERNGDQWVFFEDISYRTGRGTISCAQVTPEGLITPPQAVAITGTHLSYPNVFVADGDTFMIPESSADNVVRLYRATAFPLEWQTVADLYSGSAVDTSVWTEDGLWWFFTTIREPRSMASMLMLFFADSKSGPWISHPSSPISLDVRNARGAGAIFRSGRTLVRPSQDGSRGYGHSVTLNEIVTLTTTNYEERPLVRLRPTSEPELAGIHTYNQSGALEVIDGRCHRATHSVL
ncbi:MAG: hypothetical protein ACMG6H_13650, partial [Acidobacteriota bacterium]